MSGSHWNHNYKWLCLEVKPNGVKAWRYRFKLVRQGVAKESMFAIGDYATAPHGERPEEATARRNGGRFTLAEAREERAKARVLVKQGINPFHHRQLDRIKRGQEGATIVESKAEMRKIFRERQSYAKKVMKDMISKSDVSWAEFESYRQERKARLGIS